MSNASEGFLARNPDWKADVTNAVGGILLDIMRNAVPPPWDDETVVMLEYQATKAGVMVFEQFRDQLGDALFGDIVLTIGAEAKRLAQIARSGVSLQ